MWIDTWLFLLLVLVCSVRYVFYHPLLAQGNVLSSNINQMESYWYLAETWTPFNWSSEVSHWTYPCSHHWSTGSVCLFFCDHHFVHLTIMMQGPIILFDPFISERPSNLGRLVYGNLVFRIHIANLLYLWHINIECLILYSRLQLPRVASFQGHHFWAWSMTLEGS